MKEKSTSITQKAKYLFWCNVPYWVDVTDSSYIHHVLPVALGGTNAVSNLICTNIATNAAAEDKITFWIDDSLYQVKRIRGTHNHEIVELN